MSDMIKFVFWDNDDETLHPRYVLTDVGGLSYDHGLDEDLAHESTTDVHLHNHDERTNAWSQYDDSPVRYLGSYSISENI